MITSQWIFSTLKLKKLSLGGQEELLKNSKWRGKVGYLIISDIFPVFPSSQFFSAYYNILNSCNSAELSSSGLNLRKYFRTSAGKYLDWLEINMKDKTSQKQISIYNSIHVLLQLSNNHLNCWKPSLEIVACSISIYEDNLRRYIHLCLPQMGLREDDCPNGLLFGFKLWIISLYIKRGCLSVIPFDPKKC